jgi:hypothetical protein
MEADDGQATVEYLLRVTDGRGDAGERPADPDRVARAVLDEVVSRLAPEDLPAVPATVQVDLGAGRDRLGYLVTAGPDGAAVATGWSAEAWVRIRQDLDDLALTVFGPPGAGRDATRELLTRDEPPPDFRNPDRARQAARRAAISTAQRLLAACRPPAPSLCELSVRFGSDKWGAHWYAPHYERHFAPYRQQRIRLLELGIGGYRAPDQGGASLRMWRQYFSRGLIHGLDLFDKSALDRPRLTTVQGDQADPEFLAGLAARIGPLDIVIDDGSHLSADVLTSFKALFPLLAPGGLYVIEDLQTSFWPGWNGGRTGLDDPATSVGFLKTLVDGLHHRERDGVPPSELDETVTGLHVYHNIAFIEKGRNTEQTSPAWMSRTEHPSDWARRLTATTKER